MMGRRSEQANCCGPVAPCMTDARCRTVHRSSDCDVCPIRDKCCTTDQARKIPRDLPGPSRFPRTRTFRGCSAVITSPEGCTDPPLLSLACTHRPLCRLYEQELCSVSNSYAFESTFSSSKMALGRTE
jgi:hypothetical protein